MYFDGPSHPNKSTTEVVLDIGKRTLHRGSLFEASGLGLIQRNRLLAESIRGHDDRHMALALDRFPNEIGIVTFTMSS